MKQTLIAALILTAAASLAAADEVQLTNGRKITGKVTKKDAQKVTVEVGAGTITFDTKDVSSINPGATPLDDYEQRWSKVQNTANASELYDLLKWAKSQGLTRYIAPLATKIIALDPEHAAARAELRYEKMNGKWLTFDEAQKARGLVYMDDRWVTQAEIAMMEKRRLESKERSEAAEEARKQRREDEKAARLAAAEAYNAQANAAMSQMDGYFYTPSFAFSPYFRPYAWATYARSRNYYQNGWRYNGYGGYGGYGGGYVGLNWGGVVIR